MEHFHIIQALVRSALAQPSDATRQQVTRLKDALVESGDMKSAKSLSNILASAERSIEMAPSRVIRSKAVFRGEVLTSNTTLPVNKETSTPIADVKFLDELPNEPPIFNNTVFLAIQAILDEWSNLDKIASADIEPIRSCLIFGFPGTGKTHLALWMARRLGLPVVTARLDGLVSSFLGTTSRNIGTLFNFADRYRCLLLLDEFDAIAKFRADPHEVGEIKRVVNTLLQALDIRKNHGFTIGITNHETLLDPAIWRRFDVQLEIPRPQRDVIEQIIKRQLPPIRLSDVQIKILTWVLEGGTGSDIESLTRWMKKTFVVSDNYNLDFLPAIQQFVTLNSARIITEKRALLLGDRDVLFSALKNQLSLKVSDIAEMSGQSKSTISRVLNKH